MNAVRPRRSLGLIVLFTLAFAPGCARVPADQQAGLGKQIIVTLRVRRQIQPLTSAQVPYYYFALINRTDSPNDAGPVPVVDRPWGNGFAAAAQPGAQGFVAFVRYDRFQPQGGYGVYRVEGNPVNGIFTPLGRPDAYTTPQEGESTLTFRLDLGRLPNPDARYVQINLLATNNLPQGAEDAPKTWDALGDGRDTGTINTWLTIDTTQDGIRSDANSADLEPEGDVREKLGGTVDEPDLDLVDWSVEIRS